MLTRWGTVENLLNASKLFAVSECLNEMRMLMNINIILNFKGICKEKVAKLSGGESEYFGKRWMREDTLIVIRLRYQIPAQPWL